MIFNIWDASWKVDQLCQVVSKCQGSGIPRLVVLLETVSQSLLRPLKSPYKGILADGVSVRSWSILSEMLFTTARLSLLGLYKKICMQSCELEPHGYTWRVGQTPHTWDIEHMVDLAWYRYRARACVGSIDRVWWQVYYNQAHQTLVRIWSCLNLFRTCRKCPV